MLSSLEYHNISSNHSQSRKIDDQLDELFVPLGLKNDDQLDQLQPFPGRSDLRGWRRLPKDLVPTEHLEATCASQREARWCFDQEKPVDLHGDCDCIVDLSGFKWIYKLS